jgi:hypothetical protein
MTERNEQPTIDLIGEILSDHREIKRMMAEVETSTGEAKKQAFQRLVHKLAVHETAEEIVAHPLARKEEVGNAIVDERLQEETEAKKVLATLESKGCDDPDFDAMFQSLRAAVISHAEKEEHEEHPLLLGNISEDRLRTLGTVFRSAEATAPTHPHPAGPSSATGNVLVGPVASVIDRTRDAIRAALEKVGM